MIEAPEPVNGENAVGLGSAPIQHQTIILN